MATLTKLRALTDAERTELERLVRSWTEEARLVVRAKIVLGLAAGERPYRVAERGGVGERPPTNGSIDSTPRASRG